MHEMAGIFDEARKYEPQEVGDDMNQLIKMKIDEGLIITNRNLIRYNSEGPVHTNYYPLLRYFPLIYLKMHKDEK